MSAAANNALGLKRSRLFVNREAELAFVAERLELLARGGTAHECIINFNGVPGIGKTALLKAIADAWADNEMFSIVEIDLAKIYPRRTDARSPRLRFLRALSDSGALPPAPLCEHFTAQVFALNEDSDDNALDTALRALVELFNKLPQGLLLLIDSWDYAPDVLPPWIEAVLLQPLISANRLVAVFGSQVTMRWWQFEIRRRAHGRTLAPLPMNESTKQIGCNPADGSLLHGLSYGYPLANEYLYDELQRTRASDLAADQARLMYGIIANIQGRVLEDITPEIQRIIVVMTLFREFDVDTLRTVLPEFYSEFKTRSHSSLMLTLKELLATRLVTWNVDARAYEFEHSIRRIYAKATRLNEPEFYDAVRRAALAFYERLITDDPDTGADYVPEYLYHALYKHADDFYNELHAVERVLAKVLERVYRSRDGQTWETDELHRLIVRVSADEEIQDALRTLQAPSGWLERVVGQLGSASDSR